MNKALTKILDLFWPKQCLNCSKNGRYLCVDCQALINLSTRYEVNVDKLDYLFWTAPYKDKIVQSCLHCLKYRYVKDLAEELSDLIISYFNLLNNSPILEQTRAQEIVIISVPMYKKDLKKRGFNHSEEIARSLSKKLGIPLVEQALLKTKKTLSQMELKREERFLNVSGVFAINPETKGVIEGKKIILIDDVYTTGATMQECAKVLKQNHAPEIWGVVIARD
ncbi:hypothetical protein KKC63_01565 [Patescibacteria group bacterium]|nr:hypothetical protein [Patescibacteria group bacterium]MBU4022832.1 hypothetical protein [Patescibacteria group bacterium]MBU4078431.1 hypothetical protein [Patescibacteria group bacterium]